MTGGGRSPDRERQRMGKRKQRAGSSGYQDRHAASEVTATHPPPGHALGLTRVRRPIAWSAMITAAVLAVSGAIAAAPAYAAPADVNASTTQIPDQGARPIASGPLQLPGGGLTTAPNTGLSTLAQQIIDGENEVASLGEQLKEKTIQQ